MSNKALSVIADSIGVSVEEATSVIKGMIISVKNQHGATASDAELAIVSSTCAKYNLNPLVKECAAFISGGKLQVVLMIDGWYKIVNRQPDFDGVEFEDHLNNGVLTAITCKMYIKGRSRPVTVTEYLAECKQDKSDVWKKYPARMLRHKAYIQCARMSFGISELIDNDEADRIRSGEKDITPQNSAAMVNWQEIEARMAECGDDETLKEVSGSIREGMQRSGIWETEKHILIDMNGRHKKRIHDYQSTVSVHEAEFEEVIEETGKTLASEEQSVTDVPFD